MVTKIYLDWNIITHMKQGKHDDLFNILKTNPHFLIIYSTSHISDILVSYTGEENQTRLIYEDLGYISKLTSNYCIYIEDKTVILKQRDPKELFEDSLAQSKERSSNNQLELMLKIVEDMPEAYEAILKFKDSPLPKEISDALESPLTTERMNDLYPGLRDNPTMGNLINISSLNFSKLMQTEEYMNLRDTLQNHLSLKTNGLIDKQPYVELDKIYSNSPVGLSNLTNLLKNDNTPQWFHDLTMNYLLLDMHGFYEDRIKVTDRNKATMRNTIDDGFHSAFAATCDYYITNDNKSSKKTKEIYNKLNVNTKVFSSAEFVDYYNEYILNPNSIMIKIETEHFENSKALINELKSLTGNEDKINNIIDYIGKSNELHLQYGVIINSLLANQQQILTALTAYNGSIVNLHDRLIGVDKCLEAYAKHLEAHDGHLEALGDHLTSHDKYLDIHDQHIDLLSNRIDKLE